MFHCQGGRSHSFQMDCNHYLRHILLPPKQGISLLFDFLSCIILQGNFISLLQIRQADAEIPAIFTSQAILEGESYNKRPGRELMHCSRSLGLDAKLLMDTVVITASSGPLIFCSRVDSLTTSPACSPSISFTAYTLRSYSERLMVSEQWEVYWHFDRTYWLNQHKVILGGSALTGRIVPRKCSIFIFVVVFLAGGWDRWCAYILHNNKCAGILVKEKIGILLLFCLIQSFPEHFG